MVVSKLLAHLFFASAVTASLCLHAAAEEGDPRIIDAEDIIPKVSVTDASPESESIVQAAPLAVQLPKERRVGLEAVPLRTRLSEQFQRGLHRLFGIQQIQVTGGYHLSEDQVIEALGEHRTWAWDLFWRDLGSELKRNAWVESAAVRWEYFPFQVLIEVKEADPWMVVEYAKTSWLLSRSGRLLQPLATLTDPALIVETSALPRLDGIDNRAATASAGEKLPLTPRLNYAIRILRLVDLAGGLPLEVDRFTLLPEGGMMVVPQIPQQPQIVIEPDTYAEAVEQLRSLQAVIQDINRRNETVRQIDLRFENRAVLS